MVWMIHGLDDIRWPYDNRGQMSPKFPDSYLTVEGKPRKNLNPEIEPAGNRTRARGVRSNDVVPRPQQRSILFLMEITCLLVQSEFVLL